MCAARHAVASLGVTEDISWLYSTTNADLRSFDSAGGLSYTQPALTDAVSYYKIAPSNAITFGWNYTSL